METSYLNALNNYENRKNIRKLIFRHWTTGCTGQTVIPERKAMSCAHECHSSGPQAIVQGGGAQQILVLLLTEKTDTEA